MKVIMKKLVYLLFCLFAINSNIMADNDRPITLKEMPKQAQEFISKYFSNAPIALTKMETDVFEKNYDVIFTNGNKIEFDRKGRWTKINCEYNQVPDAVIPTAIKDYIKANYPNVKVLQLKFEDNKKYEVKLSNDWELTFNKKFKLVEIDTD